MKKSILIGMTAVALTLGACGRKTPPAEVPPGEQAPTQGAQQEAKRRKRPGGHTCIHIHQPTAVRLFQMQTAQQTFAFIRR